MKVLISIRSIEELQSCMEGGADIIDLKNPDEGSLGAAAPWFIKEVKTKAKNYPVSAAIGDMPNLPGTAALAAVGAVISGADYVKIGLYGTQTEQECLKLMSDVVKAVKESNPDVIVVGAGFADAKLYNGIEPLKIPSIIKSAGADIAMLDTKNKDGRRLFDFLTIDELRWFVDESHKLGLKAALAGSLKTEDLPIIYNLGTDVTGFRGAACSKNDRKNGSITTKRVLNLMNIAKNLNLQPKVPTSSELARS
ncbi:MAG: hypothetical protein EU531_04910 [Promethearchaeota archaeon]|nr:MAG: hypothetical protein EU531_04910 [Candidatus Lokiarchaeota archaeon]